MATLSNLFDKRYVVTFYFLYFLEFIRFYRLTQRYLLHQTKSFIGGETQSALISRIGSKDVIGSFIIL